MKNSMLCSKLDLISTLVEFVVTSLKVKVESVKVGKLHKNSANDY